MTVLIGVDPHKGSHTAVAIDRDEAVIDELRVVATVGQVDALLGWAKPLGERTWAVESAGGLGYLLSQQLVAAGETVLDVPATLAARVRVLGTGRSDKNDPNDARSVAIAALARQLSPGCARRITSACCACWPNVTVIWVEPGTASPVDCTPSSLSWWPAGSTKNW